MLLRFSIIILLSTLSRTSLAVQEAIRAATEDSTARSVDTPLEFGRAHEHATSPTQPQYAYAHGEADVVSGGEVDARSRVRFSEIGPSSSPRTSVPQNTLGYFRRAPEPRRFIRFTLGDHRLHMDIEEAMTDLTTWILAFSFSSLWYTVASSSQFHDLFSDEARQIAKVAAGVTAASTFMLPLNIIWRSWTRVPHIKWE